MHARHTMSTARTCKPLRLLMFSAVACGCGTAWAAGGAHSMGLPNCFYPPKVKMYRLPSTPRHKACGLKRLPSPRSKKQRWRVHRPF